MIKYIPILMMLLLGCKSIQTKTANQHTIPKYQKLEKFKGTNNDTLAYVRSSIIDRKEKYVGKELNVLLKDLEVPVRTYLPSSSNIRGISPNLSLQFYNRNEIELKKLHRIDPVIIVVVWDTPLPKEKVYGLALKNKAVWTDEEKEYFGKQKVKDITLINFNFQ